MGHTIMVPTTFPLKEVFGNKEATGRIAKWATELAPFSLELTVRTAIKSHVLADFVAEWHAPLTPPKEIASKIEPPESHWIMSGLVWHILL